jgi:hypothetical protein
MPLLGPPEDAVQPVASIPFYSSRIGAIADVAGLIILIQAATIEMRLLSNNVYFLTD